MAQHYGPDIVTDSLVFCMDPIDKVSYPGSGTTATDIVGSNNGTLNDAAVGTTTKDVWTFDGSDYITISNSSITEPAL